MAAINPYSINNQGQFYNPNQQIPQNGMPMNSNPIVQSASPAFSNSVTNSIVWVESEDEGKNWMVGPNNRVFIFVGDNKCLYIKEKNSDGRPLPTEIYEMTKRETIDETMPDLSGYVKKEDVNSMIEAAVAKALSEQKKNNSNRNFQNHRNYRGNGGVNNEHAAE